MTAFFDTEAGQFASLAKQYMEGARVLSEAQAERGKILFRPTLGLAGHGLELMLKACVLWNGERPITSGRAGHAVISMWESDTCAPLRGHLFANAIIVAMEARERGSYPDVPTEEDVLPAIDAYVRALGELHAGGGYPLRYPADPDTMAPRTPFLVESLWNTADGFVKRPDAFKI